MAAPLMRSFSLLVSALVLAATAATAQTLPPQGTDATFDVATWNIENFGSGSGGAAQRQAVAEVIRQADVDLWALQEIVDANDFDLLLQEIVDDGYRGILGPTPTLGGSQRLAYVYNEDVVTVIGTRTILQGNEYAFAYRLPFEMRASVTVGDQTQSLRILTIHAKCCSDQESYNRRTDAAVALKVFTDDYIEDGRTLLVLGDFNDGLNSSIAGGLSPYRPFRSDPDYTFATYEIDRLGRPPTFCSNASCTSGSVVDHVMFSPDLAASFIEEVDPRYEELIDEIGSYTTTVSDHLPVLSSFTLIPVANEPEPEAVGDLTVVPNPATDAAAVRVGLAAPADVRITITDALGRRVEDRSVALGVGAHTVPLGVSALAPGVYVVRVEANGTARTTTFLRAR